MPLTPLARPSLARGAYEALLRAIVSGRLGPGERIRDKELAAQLGVSRVPVREALQRLEGEGLVETVPNSATRVAPVRVERAAQAFPVIAALQALGTRLGVPALTRVDDGRMQQADRRRAQALARGDIIAAIEHDDAFHDVLLDAAGNDELRRSLARLMPQIRRLDILHLSALAERDSAADHAAIIEACRRRDAHGAAALVEENFLRIGAEMTEVIAEAEREGQGA
jgi:DNA-binding GntR family transcriptional regulator